MLRILPSKLVYFVICLVGHGALLAATQSSFFVSPTGSDLNNGTSPASAFATLTKARDVVRTLNAKMTGDIVVEIMPGDYPVPETINFTERDAGTSGFNIVYKNYGTIGSARFIGGNRVTGWTHYKESIFKAFVGTNLNFTTIYENGIRADMARWPKRTSPFATSRGGYMTYLDKQRETLRLLDSAISLDGKPFDATGKDFSQAWIYAWQGGDGHRWCSATTAALSVSNSFITIKRCGLGWPPDNFLIEGSLDLLTRPGEFFYDKPNGVLYYASRFGGAIDQQEILIPKVVRMLDVSGSSKEDLIHNLQLSGLAFMGTDRIAQSFTDDWVDEQQSSWDATVLLKNARNVLVQNCRVADSGINGITLADGVEACVITGCLVERAGYQGIDILPRAPNNTVSNCLIRYCGELRGHGRGVNALGTGSVLSNIEVYYVPRAGVCVGENAVVSYVKVHDCVQDSGDQGGFYICGNNGASFNQCTSFHNYTDLANMDRPPTAVYNDRDASHTSWSNIDAGDSQMFVFRHDPQREGTITFNNVNWDPACNPKSNEIRNAPNPAFDRSRMEYARIGITTNFPREYRDASSVPAAPLNLWARIGNSQAMLNWTEVDHATNYTIRRASTSGGPYIRVGSSNVPATGWDLGTAYTDYGLNNDTSYYYVVTACSAAGESPASLELKVIPNPKGSNKMVGKVIGDGGNAGLAFDGKLTTYFDTGNGWAGLDLSQPCVITEIRYSPRSDNTDTTARMCGGEFQGANDPDFTKWVTLYRVLGTKGGAGTPVLIPQFVFNSTSFRYVRYVGHLGKSLVGEIEFYGYRQ